MNAPPLNGIETLAARLQGLPPERRWVHAQQDVIAAMGCGRIPDRGPRSRGADWILGILDSFGLERSAAAIIEMVFALTLYARQFFTPKEPTNEEARKCLFVGIGAMREPQLVRHFETVFRAKAICLDETNLKTFFGVHRVGLPTLTRELSALRKESLPALDYARMGEGIGYRYCATNIALHGHKIAYLRAWFREFRTRSGNSTPVGFSAASYVSHAAVSAGIRAVYLMHGFQRHSLVYPDFTEVHCLNGFEARHIESRLPGAPVSLIPERTIAIETKPIVAVAGVYGDHDFDLCRSFINWARGNGVPVVIRRHPKDVTGYWDQWRGVDGVELVDASSGFDAFLMEYRPRFLVSWYSTTLLDALLKGVLPITLTKDLGDALDVVFPFRDIALCWPEDRNLVQDVFDRPSAFSELVALMRSKVFGAASSRLATEAVLE